MPLDAITLRATVLELSALKGARIEKIYQPEHLILVLSVRGNQKLLISAGAAPRICLTNDKPENPANPPMFCMLLRKHLTGAKIRNIIQPGLERVVQIEFDTTDEMGDPSKKTLTAELFGRQANIIMQDADGRIIDCLRRVDISMSEERQILPGMFYRLPKTAGRVDFLNLSKEDVLSHISADELQEEKRLASIFMGFSPLVARELIFRAGNRKEALAEEITALAERIKAEDFAPIMLTKDDAPFDYSFMEIRQYGGAVHLERSESFSALLDGFYSERERKERQKKRAQELTRTVKAAQERLSRKLALQRDEFRQALDRENLKKYGDLIMAGLHTLNKGMQKARLTDYYEEGTPEIEIALDVKLSPQQNAQRYYKNYNRMKNAEAALKLQTEQTERELLYLESVADELNRAQTQQELQEIREELLLSGYIKDKNQKKTGKKPRASGLGPHEYKTGDGFLVLAGRNNRQNEELTLKTALKTDIWFHTQKIPGSHVILLCGGKKPTDRAKSEAAMIAAFHSKASASALVPVDFTEVRFVKKLPGGKCGMVTYKNFETAIVTPDEKIIGRLKS